LAKLFATLLLLVSQNNLAASAVATVSSVADVITAVGFPRVPAVADIPVAVLFLLLLTSQEFLLWLKPLLLPP
jgi:hypothetical protein